MADSQGQERDARELLAFSGSLHSSLIAASIAVLIGTVAFGIAGTDFSEIWDKLLPLVALAFAGTYLGTAIAHGIEARSLRKANGARLLGEAESR